MSGVHDNNDNVGDDDLHPIEYNDSDNDDDSEDNGTVVLRDSDGNALDPEEIYDTVNTDEYVTYIQCKREAILFLWVALRHPNDARRCFTHDLRRGIVDRYFLRQFPNGPPRYPYQFVKSNVRAQLWRYIFSVKRVPDVPVVMKPTFIENASSPREHQ